MNRLMSLLAISLISTNVGCSMCSDCDDYSYGAFGGRWERTDTTYGRVGSAFSPDGSIVAEGEPTQAQNQDSPVPELADPPLEELEKPPTTADPPTSDLEDSQLLDT